MKYLIYLTLSFLFIACGNNNSENSYKVDLSSSKNDSLISNKNYVVNADGDSILTGHPVLTLTKLEVEKLGIVVWDQCEMVADRSQPETFLGYTRSMGLPSIFSSTALITINGVK